MNFIKINKKIPMFYCNQNIPNVDIARNNGMWFLSKGDHDWDQYPPTS